jgi:hypothetical protein
VASAANANPAAAASPPLVLGSRTNTATAATGLSVNGTTAGYGFGVTDNGASTLHGQQPSIFAHANGQNFDTAIYGVNEGDGAAIQGDTYSTEAFSYAIGANNFGNGYAIHGQSKNAPAVYGLSFDSDGVMGMSNGFGVHGVHGQQEGIADGDGVHGEIIGGGTGNGISGVTPFSGNGAFGLAAAGSTGIGVSARSDGTGPALVARTTLATNHSAAIVALSFGTGSAFVAATTTAATNPAVSATSGSNSAAVRATGFVVPVSASVPVAGNAAALEVHGVAFFSRSGSVTLAAAASSVVVNVPGGLTHVSNVLATLQGVVAGALTVQSVAADVTNGSIRIYFTGTAPAGTRVAWFIFG